MMRADETFYNKLIIGCKNNEKPKTPKICLKILLFSKKNPLNYEHRNAILVA